MINDFYEFQYIFIFTIIFYRPVPKLSTPKGDTAVVVKYRKVKYIPLKGGCT